jgi:hypothetical protein
MGEKIVAIDKHLIVDVFKISNNGWKEQKVANKEIAKAMFYCITLLRAYVKTKQWSVSKMKPPYDIHLPTLIQVIYQRNNVCYFSNKNAIPIMTIVQGKVIDWANTLFKQL